MIGVFRTLLSQEFNGMAGILLIDDDSVMLGLVAGMLRQDGHTTLESKDPIDAISVADERRQEIDLILTDVEMEPITGFEFVKRLTRKKIYIPVLFMSGCPHLAKVIASSLGESAVIEKPFTSPALRHSVTRFLAKHRHDSNTSRESSAIAGKSLPLKRVPQVRDLFVDVRRRDV
jgi:DNA-binding NtrC family response regulator